MDSAYNDALWTARYPSSRSRKMLSCIPRMHQGGTIKSGIGGGANPYGGGELPSFQPPARKRCLFMVPQGQRGRIRRRRRAGY